MQVGDLIRWRSTGCHGVITEIVRCGVNSTVYVLCGPDGDGFGGGVLAFHQDLVERSAKVISASR